MRLVLFQCLWLVLIDLVAKVGEALPQIDFPDLVDIVEWLNFSTRLQKVGHLGREHFEKVLDSFALLCHNLFILFVFEIEAFLGALLRPLKEVFGLGNYT